MINYSNQILSEDTDKSQVTILLTLQKGTQLAGSYLQMQSYIFPLTNFSANLWFFTIASCQQSQKQRVHINVKLMWRCVQKDLASPIHHSPPQFISTV